jgi:hypothetical protein
MSKNRKRLHKIMAHNSYEHHMAAYPDGFKGIVQRDDNICIQFYPVTIKTVKNPMIDTLHKDGGTLVMKVSTNGTDIETLGLRLTYPILTDMMLELISIEKLDTLKILQAEINRMISKYERKQ